MPFTSKGGSGKAQWGYLTGILAEQEDLNEALTRIEAKADVPLNTQVISDNLELINAVGSNIDPLVTAGNNIPAVLAVNENQDNIDSVAANMESIDDVVQNMTAVNGISSHKAQLLDIHDNLSTIATVAANESDIKLASQFIEDAESVLAEGQASALEAQEWAVGTEPEEGYETPRTDNNAKYWCDVARSVISRAYAAGGYFTPTDESPYPDTEGIEVITLWLVRFSAADAKYLYETGDLAGETMKNGYQISYSPHSGKFEFVPMTVSGVASVNGKKPDETNNVTLTGDDIEDVYTTTEVIAITSKLSARIAQLETYPQEWEDLADGISDGFFANADELRGRWSSPHEYRVKGIVRFNSNTHNLTTQLAVTLPGTNPLEGSQTYPAMPSSYNCMAYVDLPAGADYFNIRMTGNNNSYWVMVDVTLTLQEKE